MSTWLALDRGRPLDALRHWRSELQAEHTTIAPYLQAAAAGLPDDPLAPLRRQALKLLANLRSGEPGEAEISQLGALLRGWGELCLSHAPGRAQEQFERAWACCPDPALAQKLADLYARQGMASGAHALAVPQPDLPPWPQSSCAGLHCQPCQQQLTAVALAPETSLEIHSLPGGRIWIERNRWFGETHGLAVAAANGELLAPLCRRYPGQWPGCSQTELRELQALDQLAHVPPGNALQIRGPVLAVADLSAELHYHAQLELLPRLGRAWQALAPQIPELRLWHNGGDANGLQEALLQLGVPPERRLCAHRHPHLQAEQLLVPGFPSAFGAPGPTSLQWLRGFWAEAIAALPPSPVPKHGGLLLARPLEQRRPLLQHQVWKRSLQAKGFVQPPSGPVARQLQAMQNSQQVVAVHGGAMVNLLLAPHGAELVELANPAYAPPYFASLIASGSLQHQRRLGAATPQVLQDLLYAGPLEWPIDLLPP
jgi:hypothetical protein